MQIVLVIFGARPPYSDPNMRWMIGFYLFLSCSYGLCGTPRCEFLFTKQLESKSLYELDRIRLMTFNLENFSFKRTEEGLPTKKVQDIANIILDQRPDVVILQEIYNKESIGDFNLTLLQDRYRVEYIEGEKGSAHHITFLVKKSLKIRYEIRSHIGEKWFDPALQKDVELFNRDFPALIVWPLEAQNARPALIVFGNHGKSRIDRPGDPDSMLMRTAQIFRMQKIASEMKQEFGKHVPMVIAGDFNANLTNSSFIHPLRKVFEDAFNLSPVPKEHYERITHTYHGSKESSASPLDAFFVNKTLSEYVWSVRVYRYRDKEGNVIPLPENTEQRLLQPSDHYPVILDISAEPLMRSAS
jgi:endonuclease/exonuclease/phosphatase family metal-dependent hydrolase